MAAQDTRVGPGPHLPEPHTAVAEVPQGESPGLADARRRPSALNASSVTSRSWPRSTATSDRPAASQMRTTRSDPPEAIEPPVRAEDRRQHLAGVTLIGGLDLPAGRNVPLADGPVGGRRQEARPVEPEGDVEHLGRMAAHRDGQGAGRRVPHAGQVVFAA